MYNELTQLTEMIRYIHKNYPDLRIVTVDQALDLLGVPKLGEHKVNQGKNESHVSGTPSNRQAGRHDD